MSVPPSYADLGKSARDLFSKGYNYGFFKLEAKTKTSSNLDFTIGANSNHDSGKFLGSLETKFKVPEYGITLAEKWNTDKSLGTEVTIEDKLVKGLKLSFDTNFAIPTSKKSGKIKTEYKREYFHSNVDLDFDFAGPTIHGAWVLGYGGWLGGYQMTFDTSKSKLTQNNFAIGFSKDDLTIHAAVNEGSELQGSVFRKINSKVEVGAQLVYSGTNSTRFGIGLKYLAHPDSTFKVRVHNNAQIGLSYQQKLQDSLTLTLSTLIEGKTFNQGGHKVGLGLDLQP